MHKDLLFFLFLFPMKIAITPAQEKDSEQIFHLAKSFDLDCEEFSWKQFLVARNNGSIIGIGRLREYEECIEVATVGVIPEERNKGIGTAIVNELVKIGPPEIYVSCVIPDFFSRFGFQPLKKFPSVLQKKIDFCKLYGFKDEEIFVMKIEKEETESGGSGI